MRLITRYLLREFLGPLVVCLVSFNAIFLVFDLFDHVSNFIESGIPWFLVLRYYASMISVYSHWFAPASLMLATLYTMWNLSRNSEITAMRASGISFHRLAAPFLSVSVLAAILIASNSEWVAPEASVWSSRLKSQNFRVKAVESDVRTQHPFYYSPGRRLWVFTEVDTISEFGFRSTTNAVSVTQERPDGINEWAVTAEGAAFLDGAWWFTRPRYTRYDIDGGELPVSDAPMGAPTVVRMAGFDETPRDMLLILRAWENYSIRDMRNVTRTEAVLDPVKRFDLYYRFASPWACVVITLLAIPAGISTARQGVMRGIFTALAAFFGFYALTHLGLFLGKQGLLAAGVAAWYPIVLCFVLGSWMYRRLT